MDRPVSTALKSLDLILDEVRVERDAQLAHFDAVDAKAGIILGFAGALVALSRSPGSGLLVAGRYTAAAAVLVATWAFFPRKFAQTAVRNLREKYLRAEPDFTKLKLLDSHLEIMRITGDLLERKTKRLKVAVGLLGTAAILISVGLGLH
jgi:hypothetical protein